MSNLNKLKKNKTKAKDILVDHNISLEQTNSDSESLGDKNKIRNKLSKNSGRNEVAKSRLTLIIDMLALDDNDNDDKSLRKNVSIALKHLNAVVDML
jgi:hypothetical protein